MGRENSFIASESDEDENNESRQEILAKIRENTLTRQDTSKLAVKPKGLLSKHEVMFNNSF